MTTTQTTPAVSAGGTPPALPPSSSRSSSWTASWRVALRLARRDVRRHRGRSLAVLLMVGVPTMLICLGLVLGATSQVSTEESVPLAMGPAQASISMTEGRRIAQAVDPNRGYADKDAPARAIPGARPGGTAEMNASAIGDLTGGQALAWSEGQSRARIGDRDLGLATFAYADPAHLTGKITLRSGRWPTRADEVLVSPRAVGRGVPDSGPLQLVVDGEERTVHVVGTALSAQTWGGSHELVTTTPTFMDEQSTTSGWFVTRTQPITWDDVTRLNEYGLAVHSAHVVAHPPTQDQIEPDLRDMGGGSDTAQLIVLGATLLLITITLLVGPAFAVGATRQRRTLALAASNGATAGQLRRTVLAQAIVLGGLSALVGAALAVPVGWAVVRAITDRGSPLGPFEVPWWQLGAICAIALLAAILAALIPAQRLTRLDIVGAMRGRVVTPPPSRWLFVLGLVATVVGGAGVIIGLDRGPTIIALAAIVLVLGALLLVPRILHTLGRMVGPLPLPLRLAVRDLARHRTRSAPTVAAVLAGSAALTMGLIGASSDDTQERQDYVPQTILGEGYIYADGPSDRDPMTAVARELPGLALTPVHAYGLPLEDEPAQSGDTVEEPFLITLPRGCTVTDVVDPGAGQEPQGDVEMAPGEWPGARCVDGSSGSGSAPVGSSLALMPAAEIIRRFELTGDEARTVSDGGGVLVATDPGDLTSDGQVELARGTMTVDSDTGEYALTGQPTTSRVPVIERTRSKDTFARSWQAGFVLPTEAAERAGWPLTVNGHLVHDPDGAIDSTTEERVQQLLGDESYVSIERGWQNPLAIVIAVLIGIFTLVLLVVTLTATALSMAEQERDQATIAAVGGSRRTRRLMVAAQTWLLATIGIVLGLVVGTFPGITIARALTSEGTDVTTGLYTARDAVVDIPWPPLAIVLLAVPALAALLAGLGIRRTPDLTRRTE